jgi:hypothetical protein
MHKRMAYSCSGAKPFSPSPALHIPSPISLHYYISCFIIATADANTVAYEHASALSVRSVWCVPCAALLVLNFLRFLLHACVQSISCSSAATATQQKLLHLNSRELDLSNFVDDRLFTQKPMQAGYNFVQRSQNMAPCVYSSGGAEPPSRSMVPSASSQLFR